jgi:hypothetical protein
MAAVTSPEVILAGRTTAERAPDARAGRVEALLLIRLAIQNDETTDDLDASSKTAHMRSIMTQFERTMEFRTVGRSVPLLVHQ